MSYITKTTKSEFIRDHVLPFPIKPDWFKFHVLKDSHKSVKKYNRYSFLYIFIIVAEILYSQTWQGL